MLDNLLSPAHLIIMMPMLLLWLGIYTLPTIVAALRSHRSIFRIALVNILLGWSLIGWVIAFIWACTTPAPILAKSAEPLT